MLGFWGRRDADVSGDPTMNLRYANEWVGGLVLVAIGVFIFVVIQAGVLLEWLTPSGRLHFQLPQSGIAGLAVGNDVELMGTRIGTIREVKINDHGNMYAIATIDPQFEPFIRDDSKAVIKRRFVVAGASYIELARGQGAPLDWAFATVRAEAEQNPGDLIIKTVNDVRAQLVPTIQSAENGDGPCCRDDCPQRRPGARWRADYGPQTPCTR
ncbi:MAG: MCE family protein [Acetobacteraceae bacterium]